MNIETKNCIVSNTDWTKSDYTSVFIHIVVELTIPHFTEFLAVSACAKSKANQNKENINISYDMQYLRLIPNYYYYYHHHHHHHHVLQMCLSFNMFHIRALIDKSLYTIRPTNARILNMFITCNSLRTFLQQLSQTVTCMSHTLRHACNSEWLTYTL